MAYSVDGRGSKDQKILYDMLVSLYPRYEVVYEFPLYEINQRLDLFIPALGICVEFDGRQHIEFVEHFHKDAAGWKKSYLADEKKNKYLEDKGVKLIRIPYNYAFTTKEELLKIINDTEYPLNDYSGFEVESPKKKSQLDEARQARKDNYKKAKDRKSKQLY